ncbi:DUF6314 family protein [Sinomonas notoginsengisoli]|uniref:DUF6314 family protein n=1 Tax=Sinomonas notoginsengisoli TaxID=1457311 RepID=UPI001F41549D|nr:DUF6314 family protein [Sinomonas notoginsengisoli]
MADLAAYLAGTWTVERTMLDRASGVRGSFAGSVTFEPMHDGALAQREHGTVRWGNHSGPASREYTWQPGPSAGVMEVFFPDGRPFHTVDLTGASAEGAHWCSPDDYRVHYEAVGPDELQYTWDVRGPAKDLLLESVLRRAQGVVVRAHGA